MDWRDFMSAIASLLMFVFIIFVAYFVIQVAVRHGIESSETHKLLKEIKNELNSRDE